LAQLYKVRIGKQGRIVLPKELRAIRDYLKVTKIRKYEMDLAIFEQALELIEITPIKRPKDAINVATMLKHRIPKIISEDKGYDKVSFLVERVHPKDLSTV